ncbi:MAG: CRISPR-associated endonuclease Cas1 [Candidatus Competibacteraceae bacterium]|nr:CRISPR-associated endonuclease Cas1 [Candidatus Competibacteraceae bacterium]
MDTIYLLRGTEIKRDQNTLVVVTEDRRKRRLPVQALRHVVVLGATRLNSEVATFLGKHGVRLSFLDYYGHFSGSLDPARHHHAGSVHLAQAKTILNDVSRLTMASRILEAGAANMLRNLKYYLYRGLLNPNGRERVLREFREWMDNAKIAGEVGWRRIFLKEAFAIEAHLLELSEYEPFMVKA